MIAYNNKDWYSFVFSLHKADTFHKLYPLMISIACYSAGIAYLEIDYFNLIEHRYIKNLTITHSILGFVISLLLAYRTNTAYDRWWEGRKLWGELVNNSRNFAIKISTMVSDQATRNYFKTMIPNYAIALNQHLKNTPVHARPKEIHPLDLDYNKHSPNQIARLLFQKINELYKQGTISGAQLRILAENCQTLTNICGACERIKNTPTPYSYSLFTKKFIFFFVMTLPFGYVFSLGYFVVPLVVFIFYVLASLELISEEIEDPFGEDANDLPTERIANQIRVHIEEII